MRLSFKGVRIWSWICLAFAIEACGSESGSLTAVPSQTRADTTQSIALSARDSSTTPTSSVSAAFLNDPTRVTVDDAAIALAIANLPATARSDANIASAGSSISNRTQPFANLSNDLVETVAGLTRPTDTATLSDAALTLSTARSTEPLTPQNLVDDVRRLMGNTFSVNDIVAFPGRIPNVGGEAVVVQDIDPQFAANVASVVNELPSSVALGIDVSFPPAAEILFPSAPDPEQALRVSFEPPLTPARNNPEPYNAADLGCEGNVCRFPNAIDVIPFQFLPETDDYRVIYELRDATGTTIVSRFVTIRPREDLPIASSGLLDAISESLRIPVADLNTADASQIISLDASSRSIGSLVGIEVLSTASSLDLGSNQIAEAAPIAALTNRLTDLDLANNTISDITPLTSLAALRTVDLTDNQITDLTPLLDNPGLDGSGGDRVDVGNNPIDENSLNVVIPELQQRGSGIPIVFDVPFADEALKNVIRSSLRLSPASSISNIDARSIISLNASDVGIQSIDGVEALGSSSIDLSNNQITDISAFAATPPYLQGTSFVQSDTALLKENVTTLDLSNNPITEIAALAELPVLRVLTMTSTQVSDLSPLLDNPGLNGIGGDRIDVSNNVLDTNTYQIVIPEIQQRQVPITFDVPIADPNLAAALRDSRGLGSDEPITNLEAFLVTRVEASNRDITSLEGIEALGADTLDLSDNQISDLSPLLETQPYLPGTILSRTTTLRDNLTSVNVSGNPLDDNSLETVIPQLESLGIEVTLN